MAIIPDELDELIKNKDILIYKENYIEEKIRGNEIMNKEKKLEEYNKKIEIKKCENKINIKKWKWHKYSFELINIMKKLVYYKMLIMKS